MVLLFAVALLAACGGQRPLKPARIAFVSNRDGNYEIYLINVDGSGLTRLTNNPAAGAWKPEAIRQIGLIRRLSTQPRIRLVGEDPVPSREDPEEEHAEL